MRFAELSPGLASALESLGDGESIMSSTAAAAAGSTASTTSTTSSTTVGVDDLVSLFTTADDAEAQRNNAENENLARFLKPAEDKRAERRDRKEPETKTKAEEPPREKLAKDRPADKPQLARTTPPKSKEAAPIENAPAQDAPLAEEPSERREVELRMAEDPRAATKHRERSPAKKHARAEADSAPREQTSKQHPATRDSARVRATQQEAQLRSHLEAKKTQSQQKEGLRAENRAEQRRADRKDADRKAFAQLDSQQQTRDSKPQDKERALAWKEGFEGFENMNAKGGHGWADFILGSEDVEDGRLGLNEADLLSDGQRCKGHIEDGTRCLRRPREGEMYCSEHRNSLPTFWD